MELFCSRDRSRTILESITVEELLVLVELRLDAPLTVVH